MLLDFMENSIKKKKDADFGSYNKCGASILYSKQPMPERKKRTLGLLGHGRAAETISHSIKLVGFLETALERIGTT